MSELLVGLGLLALGGWLIAIHFWSADRAHRRAYEEAFDGWGEALHSWGALIARLDEPES